MGAAEQCVDAGQMFDITVPKHGAAKALPGGKGLFWVSVEAIGQRPVVGSAGGPFLIWLALSCGTARHY